MHAVLKNAIDACVATVVWWGVGSSFAYGKCGQNGFIGAYNFFSSEASATGGSYWAVWLFNWAFASTAATIVSGAVAERLQFKCACAAAAGRVPLGCCPCCLLGGVAGCFGDSLALLLMPMLPLIYRSGTSRLYRLQGLPGLHDCQSHLCSNLPLLYLPPVPPAGPT
jgi:hypothetical protein